MQPSFIIFILLAKSIIMSVDGSQCVLDLTDLCISLMNLWVDLADLFEEFPLIVFFQQVYTFDFIEVVDEVGDVFMLVGNIFFCLLLYQN